MTTPTAPKAPYEYHSTGITRKVLIALEQMPFGGCMMMAGAVGVALTPLTFWLLKTVLGWFGVTLPD